MGITIDTIRTYCGFSSPNSIRQTWQDRVHPNIPFPGRHEELPAELAKPLLQYMMQPGNGRKPRTTNAAAALLDFIQTGMPLPPLEDIAEQPAPKVKPIGDSSKQKRSESETPPPGESETPPKPESETPPPGESETPPKPKEVARITFTEWLTGTFGDFMPIDLVTYGSIVLMFVSSYAVIPDWPGLLFGFLLSVVLLNALFIAKNQKTRDSAWHAALGVWMSEAISLFLHWTMFYNVLKQKYVSLPWELAQTRDGNYKATAFIMAFIVCIWSVYAIYNRINVTKALAYARWFKQQHGVDY